MRTFAVLIEAEVDSRVTAEVAVGAESELFQVLIRFDLDQTERGCSRTVEWICTQDWTPRQLWMAGMGRYEREEDEHHLERYRPGKSRWSV
jgi:hypothetical protein